MSKRGGSHSNGKQALVREPARRKPGAGRKGAPGAMPKTQPRSSAEPRSAAPPTGTATPRTATTRTTTTRTAQPRSAEPARVATPPPSTGLAVAHDREFARMNERIRPAHRARPPIDDRGGEPRYLTDAARGLLRRMVHFAKTPFAVARAVVDRLRDRD